MSAPVDNAQRLAALDPTRSVCVTAPAGSGKTELLSQRVLTLLARAGQPEEILAITFTRKAAAEMHHRIIQALHFAQQSPEPDEPHRLLTWQLAKSVLDRDAECEWHLLQNTGRLKVQTIDSLCASLTRQMPILSNFGAQPKITDKAELCYRAAVQSFLLQLEQNSLFSQDLMTLLRHVDNDMVRVERLLMTLLQRRDQWLLHIGISSDPVAAKARLEKTLQLIISDLLEQLYQLLSPIGPELAPLLDYAGCNIGWQKLESIIGRLAGVMELPGVDVSAVEQWQAIAELLLTRTGDWRKTVDKRAGFPTETQEGDKVLAKALKGQFVTLLKSLHDNEALHQCLVALRHLPAAAFDQQQWMLLEALTRLLPGLVAQLTLVFQQQGEVDYSQISMAALQALGNGLNPTELAMKLDYRLCHILVDEFQDTASTQYNLLQRLLEGWEEYNTNNPERPNTLFIVGDGMQSIYGFREANVGLFLEARKQGVMGVKLDDLPLTVNFRSDPAVVGWVNATFQQAFPQIESLSRGAVPFECAKAFHAEGGQSDIAVFGFSGEQAREHEANKTVSLVQQAQQQNPEGSIAILVRSRGHLRDIIPALSRAGLRWNATDIDPLSSYSPIIDLLSLTKALFNIADQVSWTALLRAPWIGLNNVDLFVLLSGNTSQSIWSSINDHDLLAQLTPHGRNRLTVVTGIINAAMAQRARQSARAWVEGVWLALGGAAVVTGLHEFGFIDDYFDLLESFQQGEVLSSIAQFEQAVLSLYAAPEVASCSLQVMTIHKAKGLEFDTVILPAMGRSPRSDDKSLLMWREYLSSDGHESGLVISPPGAAGGDEDSIYRYLRYEQAQASQLENTRLFYVAATRAVHKLYVLLTSELDAKSAEPKPPSKNSLISSAWSALKDSVQWTLDAPLKAEQFGLDFESPSPQAQLQRLEAGWREPCWQFTNPLESYYLTADATNEENTPAPMADPLPQCVGTVVHWILEYLVEEGVEFWLSMKVQERERWLDGLLHYHRLSTKLWPQARQQITMAINNTVSDTRGRWLLSGAHENSVAELSLLSTLDGKVKSQVIDRSFIDEKGDVWIIDYKTSGPHQDESRREFINREIAEYRSQLWGYKSQLSAFQQSGRQIRTALYFTCYPYWQELE